MADEVTIKLDKRTIKQLEKQVQNVTMEMENCLDSLHDTTCYELIRTDKELIWIKFNHDENKVEIIREEQS